MSLPTPSAPALSLVLSTPRSTPPSDTEYYDAKDWDHCGEMNKVQPNVHQPGVYAVSFDKKEEDIRKKEIDLERRERQLKERERAIRNDQDRLHSLRRNVEEMEHKLDKLKREEKEKSRAVRKREELKKRSPNDCQNRRRERK